MQVNEAVSQTADEFLVVVSGAQDQVPVDSQDPERVKKGYLLRDGFVRPGELVQDGPVEAVIDCIQWQPLGSSLWLEKWEILYLVKWEKTKTNPKPCLAFTHEHLLDLLCTRGHAKYWGAELLTKKYKALAITRFWAQETHKCDVRRWVLCVNRPPGEESCQPSWEWSSLPEKTKKCQPDSISYPQVLAGWSASTQNYTQKWPKTLVKTLSDVLLSSYLRTFLWLIYKFILKFSGDMKEPLHHMPTTHDKGLSYVLHRVEWDLSLVPNQAKAPQTGSKMTFSKKQGSNGLCADSTARREYSFNSKSSCSVSLSSYYKDLSNPVNIRSLNQRQVIQLWV